ncbi:hypothetical protein LQG66_36250 [Bradyrhizobium ontarionense]|uniref:Surface antigen domain-containing protein n=2 Tax=Bradyrhizobium ontarionense TaxID=2898149 RepID=A0ABY3RB68_9BRAD|nr:hypothetical protein [Bradyrhizobium sp. A19]UFZ04576.1 hypothetical protein LQG66_36250 [Bradyrhizobium sp. A19]
MRLMASRFGLLTTLLVAGCAADSHSRLPAFMRANEPAPPQPEAPPDVPMLVRKNLDMIFVATTQPRDLETSAVRRADQGDAWTACVRAQITAVSGAPLRRQTYRLTIKQGEIIDRRRAVAGDDCISENYQAVLPTK